MSVLGPRELSALWLGGPVQQVLIASRSQGAGTDSLGNGPVRTPEIEHEKGSTLEVTTAIS